MTRDFFYTLPSNILRSFWGLNLLWHLLAIGATVLSVSSGFDWLYFEATRPFASYLFPAVILGWRMPVVFPIVSYILGFFRKDLRTICTGIHYFSKYIANSHPPRESSGGRAA